MAVILGTKGSFAYIENDEDVHLSIVSIGDSFYFETEDGELYLIGDKETTSKFFNKVKEVFDL